MARHARQKTTPPLHFEVVPVAFVKAALARRSAVRLDAAPTPPRITQVRIDNPPTNKGNEP